MRSWRIELQRRWAGGSVQRTRPRALRIEQFEERHVLSGVVTIGDSWAWLVAAGAPGSASPAPGFVNSLGDVMNAFQPGVPVYNESFGGGTAAQMVTQLYSPGGVIDRVNAHPDADVVWLSAGGNDMLLGNLGGGFYVNNPNNPAVYAAIQANVQTIVDAILTTRPDLQVVVMGYDYLNIWDTVSGSTGDSVRFNLGVGKTGIPALDATQNLAVNDGFKAAEAGKTAIAAASRRVAHVNNFGLNNTYGGYTGYFGNFAAGVTYPPELYPYLPTPANRMNTTDPIHLNSLGYTTLALHAEQDFLLSAFSPTSLGLSTTSLAFGDTRIGTSSVLDVIASNTGPNFTKIKNLQFGSAGGDFSGGGQLFDPLFQDPALGSDTATVGYTFTPTNHAVSNSGVNVTSDVGVSGVTLSGRGVGPQFSSAAGLVFDPMGAGGTQTEGLAIANVTPDGDLGDLTNLSLLSAEISGPDAARFSLPSFTAGSVIAAGGGLNLDVQFDATGAAPGAYDAMLTLTTDEDSAFGAAGSQFVVNLSASVTPGSSVALLGKRLFYNNSKYDGNSTAINSADDGAIATNKAALLPGVGMATFANVSSYSRGINGIMLDFANAGAITASDFIFKVGNNNTPSSWADAPAPLSVSVRAGAGSSGSDRVEIVWADNAIQRQWLEVIVLANANTGLSQKPGYPAGQAEVFFWGHALADSGLGDTATQANVNSTDETGARNNPQSVFNNIPVTNAFDYNRDGAVNTSDQLLARNNSTSIGNVARFLSIANPPAAPEASPAVDSAVAVGVVLSRPHEPIVPAPPTWIATRLAKLESATAPLARFLSALAHEREAGAQLDTDAGDSLSRLLDLNEDVLDDLRGQWS